MRLMLRSTQLGLACALVLATVMPARALMIAPSPISQRVAAADAVLVGKVTAFADKLVKAEEFKDDTREMQIATVKVEDSLLGKKVKEIKVGFFPPPMGGRPIGRPFVRGGVQLTVGQEGMLFLTKHPTKKDVYVVRNYFDVVTKKDNPNFATELTEAKKYAKLLAKPMEGLESKDGNERFLTAAMLITRYKTAPVGGGKTEAVPAKETKLILNALAESDWKAPNPALRFMNGQSVFYQLRLTAKDGWTQPKDFRTFETEAKKWLKDNAEKYKMERYIRAIEKDPTEPGE